MTMNNDPLVLSIRPLRARQASLVDKYYVESPDGFAATFCDGSWQLGCLFDNEKLQNDFIALRITAQKFLWRARMSFVLRELEKLDCWRNAWQLHFRNEFARALEYFSVVDEMAEDCHVEVPGHNLDNVLKLLTTWSLARSLALINMEKESSQKYAEGEELIRLLSSVDTSFNQAAHYFAQRFKYESNTLGTHRFDIFEKSVKLREYAAVDLILNGLRRYGEMFGGVPDGMTFKFAAMIGDPAHSLIYYPGLPPLNPISSKPTWPRGSEADDIKIPGGFLYRKIDTWSCEITSSGCSDTDADCFLAPRKIVFETPLNHRSTKNRDGI